MTKRCLVFAAHPDDETNGVGGTLLLLAKAGWEIKIVYGTLPEDPKIAALRRQACHNVCATLPADREIWALADAKLVACDATFGMARRVYAEFKPDLVLVMSGNDVHPDHRAMASIGMGPALQKGVNTEIFLYELCSSGRHTDGDRPQTLGFCPTHYVDTTSVINDVADLQRFHGTEDPEAMVIGMKRMHRVRASEADIRSGYAEAFVRLTRVGPLQHGLETFFLPTTINGAKAIGIDFLPENVGL